MKNGNFTTDRITARYRHETLITAPDNIDYMDVSPRQLVSVATAQIPFLENDDANRALMGSNMQRQAVPLLRTDSSLVGTGMEFKTAYDSGAVIKCKAAGTVERVQSNEIRVKRDDNGKGRIINGRTGEVFEGEADEVRIGYDIYILQKIPAFKPRDLHEPGANS